MIAVGDMSRVLREAEEQQVITASDYPKDTHRFILELMRAFQLCYASEEKRVVSAQRGGLAKPLLDLWRGDEGGLKPVRYLVPELLPEFEPETKWPWEKSPVRLRYRYEVLQPGLQTRHPPRVDFAWHTFCFEVFRLSHRLTQVPVPCCWRRAVCRQA
jgi:hypothetical protein